MNVVSETTSFNSDVAEKNFRDSRRISTPEDLVNRKGRRPDVCAMRTVLQNWWNPKDISSTQMKPATKSNYRYLVKRYLNGDKTLLSSKQIPLIEEYREYITNQPETPVSIKKENKKRGLATVQNKKTAKLKETVLIKETKKNLSIPMEFIEYIKNLGVKEFTLRF